MNPLDDAINAALYGGGHKHPGHGGHGGGGPVDPIPTVLPDPIIYDRASHTGHTALYTVFVIMLISTVLFALLGFRLPASKRLYHVITTTIVATATLSYFAMASSAHWPLHCNHHGSYTDNTLNSFSFYPGTSTLVSGASHSSDEKPHWECRQVLWPRYADWAITTPLLLLDLCLLAGIDGAATVVAILADVAMVLTGLFAALAAREGVRWAWYAMACAAYVVVIYVVGIGGLRKQKAARDQGSGVARVWTFLAVWTLVIWTLYPIIWGFAEGANKMSVDKEIIAYAILDILAKPVFGLVLLVAHSRIPETNVDIGGWWANGLSPTGRIRIGDDEDA